MAATAAATAAPRLNRTEVKYENFILLRCGGRWKNFRKLFRIEMELYANDGITHLKPNSVVQRLWLWNGIAEYCILCNLC